MKIALLQLTSSDDIAANIARVESLVAEAAGKGAQFVATPENTFLMEKPGVPRALYAQEAHDGVIAASRMAKQYGVWLLVGSVAVVPDAKSEKTYNRSLLFNPQGEIAAHYDKIHLFDVEVGDGQNYRESAKMLAGEKIVISDLCLVPCEEKLQGTNHKAQGTKLGMTICYDLRFPHLYRRLAKQGAQILAVPSAFTAVTGEAHWHVLLRARAIENGCFIIAPAQTGTHPGGRKTFGHSLIVDPWGKILADGGTEEGVVLAEIDVEEVAKVRKKIPSLEYDREFTAS